MPPMYNYSFAPLQRSYSLNILGRTCDFPITVWVRYSSERPTTPGGPLHPGRRRPRGLLTTPYHDAGVARSSPVFAFRPEEQRRRATSALDFSVLGVLSSPSDPKTSEDGPPPYLLLASASESLTSCLRAPSATGPKVVYPTVAPRSLGPIFGRGVASTPWAPSASRSATLRAGRRDGSRQSTVRVHL